jgi:hypothetical protein
VISGVRIAGALANQRASTIDANYPDSVAMLRNHLFKQQQGWLPAMEAFTVLKPPGVFICLTCLRRPPWSYRSKT